LRAGARVWWGWQNMQPVRLLFAAALGAAALAAAPAAALAAPPQNDNYLSSLPVNSLEFTATADTTEATVQGDIFNPSRDGQPLGGAGPENTTCKGTPFGRTVWYDLAPNVNGGVQIRATGFPTVVAVYEWNPRDSRIREMVDCSASAANEDLILDLSGKRNYTIQVGGVNGAGGAMTLKVDFFADSDADGVLDALDKCRSVPGIERFGGCPPKLDTNARISVDYTSSGVIIRRLWVEHVPKGAKVVARCGGCGSQTVRARRTGTVNLKRLAGRAVSAGRAIEIRVTMARQKRGTYRFGATGRYRKWPIRAGALGATRDRCLNVRSGKLERC
jgi:hypothetical protein